MDRRIGIRALLLGLCLCLLPLSSQALGKKTVIAGRSAYEWPPANPQYEKAPIVLFSHELGQCANQYDTLLNALSIKGFWVIAPNHADAVCNDGWNVLQPNGTHGNGTTENAEKAPKMKRYQQWTATTYADRRDDLTAVLDALRSDPQRQHEQDFSRIVLAGQGLGGYIVLGMAGARPEWAEGWNNQGIRAVLAFTPYVRPYNALENAWQSIRLPVMLQSGPFDRDIKQMTEPEKGAYARIAKEKYFVAFRDADPKDWQTLTGKQGDGILRYTLAFLDYYLTGAFSPVLTSKGSSLALFGYESALGYQALSDPNAPKGRAAPSLSATPTARHWRDRGDTLGSPKED